MENAKSKAVKKKAGHLSDPLGHKSYDKHVKKQMAKQFHEARKENRMRAKKGLPGTDDMLIHDYK